MKRIIGLLIFIIMASCSINKQKNFYEPILHASIIRQYDSVFSGYCRMRLQKVSTVRLALVNNSDEKISVWLWSCSREANFIFDSDNFFYYDPGCDSNAPWIYWINSKDSIYWDACIIKKDPNLIKNNLPTRLGFRYIDPRKYKNGDDFPDYNLYKYLYKTIWSNPLYFK
jgi:hypothetical protein